MTLLSKCQIDSEDFVNFCGLLKIHELSKFIIQMPNLKFQPWDSLEHSRVNESAKKISVRTKTTCDVFVKQKCLGTP